MITKTINGEKLTFSTVSEWVAYTKAIEKMEKNNTAPNGNVVVEPVALPEGIASSREELVKAAKMFAPKVSPKYGVVGWKGYVGSYSSSFDHFRVYVMSKGTDKRVKFTTGVTIKSTGEDFQIKETNPLLYMGKETYWMLREIFEEANGTYQKKN